MKNILFGVVIGILLCVIGQLVFCKRTPEKPTEPPKKEIVYVPVKAKPDTVLLPIPEVKWYPKEVFIDRIQRDTFLKTRIDTLKLRENVATNVYWDSIKGKEWRLDYRIETYGYLLDFQPTLEFQHKTETITRVVPCKEKNWTAGFGLSNKLNLKPSVGYKGWKIEPVFTGNDNLKFQEIYLTKEIKF